MNNTPRHALKRIIAKYGTDLCGDKRRCEGLLKDLCGEYRREINVLINALEERVALDLLAAGNSMPRGLLLNKLIKRLEDNLGLTKEASDWAVNSWAFALGLLNEAEISEKEKNQTYSDAPSAKKPIPPVPQNPKIQPSNQSSQAKPSKPPTQTQPQPQMPKTYPPISRTPVNVPIPAPKPAPSRSGSNVNIPQKQPPSNNPISNAAPKRRFSKFFGCLFVLFLLVAAGIVLIFGVPYAINVMRETQQSEPPRFPPQ